MPLISVVMSVQNDEPHIDATLDSVLSQESTDLELIVIDDGSTDRTGEILDNYAMRDPRLRVVHQDNTGLTRALVRGCGLARGKYIARQDGGGDLSLPGRLHVQSDFLDANPGVVMVSCGTRFVGPERELLYEVARGREELQEHLMQLSGGPSHHGSTMFRKTTYLEIGGYRPILIVAQDIDLWLRLSERGLCFGLPEILYEARLSPESISAKQRRWQIKTNKIILECARLRRAGLNDTLLLNQYRAANKVSSVQSHRPECWRKAAFYFFIGSVLRARRPDLSSLYFKKSRKSCVFYVKSWVALFSSRFLWGRSIK